jgi:heavy metal sensor kinase
MRAQLRRTRVRLTAAYAALFTVLATCAGLALWAAFQHAQFEVTDSELTARLQTLADNLTDETPVSFDKEDIAEVSDAEQEEVGGILLGPGGRVLDTIGTPVSAGLARTLMSHPAPGAAEPVPETRGDLRVLGRPVDLGLGIRGFIVVDRPLAVIRSHLDEARTLLVLIVVPLVIIASGLGYWLAGRALKPVRVIAGAARDISERDLNRRLELDLPPDELGELAETFNGMLARLEAAFGTLRRFTADAAHELRAPLALIRAELEVSLARDRSAADYRATHRLVLIEVERMSRLADQLLLLARADAGSLAPRFERIDLSDLLEETVDRWRSLAGTRGVRLALEPPPPGPLWADPQLLRRLVDNLLDNAVRHSPEGEEVVLTAEKAGDRWRLEVADAGPGVPPSIHDTLFQRFTRGDPARGRDTGGAGLGLALCAVIAGLHGGGIRLAPPDGPPPGAHFVVELAADPRPATPPAAASPGAGG